MPLTVWQEDGQPPLQYHIVLTGHIADVPQTAISACCIGHTAEKGCPRCFILGTQTGIKDGTAYTATRFLGYSENINVSGFTEQGEYFVRETQFTQRYQNVVSFKREDAQQASITHRLHEIRARTATDSSHKAAAVPGQGIPNPIPHDSTPEEHKQHRKGVYVSIGARYVTFQFWTVCICLHTQNI